MTPSKTTAIHLEPSIRKAARALCAVVAAMATACGGGGEPASAPAPSGGGDEPASAPAPSVARFPSGSPATFYATSHASIYALADLTKFPDGTAQVTRLRQVGFIGSPSFGNLESRGSNQYAVEFYGFGGPVFGPSLSTGSDDVFDRFRGADSGLFANLELARKRTDLPLDYATFGNVIYASDAFNNVEVTFFAVGSPTPPSSRPGSGVATYEGLVDGLWIDGNVTRRLFGSRARFTVNSSTGEATYSLELRGYDDAFGNFAATTATPLASFVGTTSINRQYSELRFDFAPTAGYSGSFAGEFLGPSAEEISMSFRLVAGPGQVIFGAVAGRR